ncbi:hypothetical protein G3I60_04945 [Streptomyces sp. SID13666]|uniref:hypothetical protein n=1 Tax=Streptomyces sp. SID13666 TaxID=2706054 RepID=UPI0013BF0A63|nr:hypothetical protein [Streptomyces sp. SID13666]NEA53516.1 hypothetical protein [Streptomyces sp. SID13666]
MAVETPKLHPDMPTTAEELAELLAPIVAAAARIGSPKFGLSPLFLMERFTTDQALDMVLADYELALNLGLTKAQAMGAAGAELLKVTIAAVNEANAILAAGTGSL